MAMLVVLPLTYQISTGLSVQNNIMIIDSLEGY